MSEAKEPENKEGEVAPKKSKKKLFIILGVVLLLVGAGVPAALMLTASEEPKEENAEPVELEPVLETYQLDPIIVNLSESTSFLKVTLVIEYDLNILNAAGGTEEGGGHGYGGAGGGGGDKPAGPPVAISSKMHHIKDAVIRVLSSKTATDVLSPDGKESLKEELLEAINDATGLDEAAVVSVYFLEFIIQ
jgi:flagellar FliL protein